MNARILRGEVAAAGLRPARRDAPVGSTAVTTAPGANRASSRRASGRSVPLGREQHELAADRVDRDLHAAVVVHVGRGEAASVQAQAGWAECFARVADAAVADGARTAPAPRRSARFVTGIAPAASTRPGLPEFSRSTHDAPQPAKPLPSAGSTEGRAFANAASRRRETAVRGRRLAARVGDEQARAVADGDAHARRTDRRRLRPRRAPRSGSRARPGRPRHRRATARSRRAGSGPRRSRRRGRAARRRSRR